MQGPLQIGSFTSLDKTPRNGECCILNWESLNWVAQGRWAIDGLRIIQVGLELGGPLLQELMGEPHVPMTSLAGGCSLCQWGTGWSQTWNLWATHLPTGAVSECLCVSPALGIDYRPTKVVPAEPAACSHGTLGTPRMGGEKTKQGRR